MIANIEKEEQNGCMTYIGFIRIRIFRVNSTIRGYVCYRQERTTTAATMIS